jgi:hypothetical protein
MASGRDDVDQLLGISIEQLTKQVPFRHIPHRHDFYHLFWIESGNGTFVSDGRSYPLTRGSLIFRSTGPSSRLEMGIAKRLDSGSNPVRGSASVNLHRPDDFRNRVSAKLSKRILFRSLLSTVGGCSTRSLARSASVRNSAESDTLSAFCRMRRIRA